MGICSHTGSIDWGYIVKRIAIIKANIAMTIHNSKNMISRNSVRTRRLIMSAVKSPRDFPFPRREITRAPKSCTAPIKIDPKNTQIKAGTHPQIRAIAGPTIGPNPAIEVK